MTAPTRWQNLDVEEVKQFIGKRAKIILKSDIVITTTIPPFKGKELLVVDKFGNKATINCSDITTIIQLSERGGA